MKSRGFLSTIVLLGLLAGSLAFAMNTQRQAIAKLRKVPPFVETWEFAGRSGDVLQYLTMRYDMVAADFLYLRAIQSFGGRGMTNRDWVPIFNLFDTITVLDPFYEAVYTFGNLVIGDEGGKQEEGLVLLEKGTWKVFRRYRAPFEALYVNQWSLNNSERASLYGRIAKKRPDSPDWLPRIVAYVEIASGQFYIGVDRYFRNLTEAIDQNSIVLEDISLNKTAETIMLWNAKVLSDAIDRHTSATGTLPSADLRELAGDQILANTELASFPHILAGMSLLSERLRSKAAESEDIIEEGSFVRSGIHVPGLAPHIARASAEIRDQINAIDISKSNKLADYQPQLFQLALRKNAGVPVDPYGRGMAMNMTIWSDKEKPLKERLTSIRFIEEATADVLRALRASVDRRKGELGRNPQNWNEVFLTDFKTTESLGGRWIYDPATATVKSSSFPEL